MMTIMNKNETGFTAMVAAVVLLAGLPGTAADATAGSSASEPESPTIILTTSGELLQGAISGFADGFMLLTTKTRVYEISPSSVRAVFSSLGDAKRARKDSAWLERKLAKARKKPSRKPVATPGVTPPGPEPGPQPPIHTPASSTGNTGPVNPAPPDPDPATADRPAIKIPAGGSELEQKYFAKEPPATAWELDGFYARCLEEAKTIAHDYRIRQPALFQKRARLISRVALKLANKPETMLVPDTYRPVVLSIAFARESGLVILERMRNVDNDRERRELGKQLRKKVNAAKLYGWINLRAVDDSDLTAEEKSKVRERMRRLHEAMSPPRPGRRGKLRGHGFRRE